MAYCADTDIEARISAAKLSELTGDDGDVTDAAIASADSLIDGHYTPRYGVTTTATAQTKRLSVEISCYHLYQRTPSGPAGSVPESILQGYQDALKFLEALAEGKVSDPEMEAHDRIRGIRSGVIYLPGDGESAADFE